MNIQEYIESGKLDLFLLGEFTEREREEVIAMAKAHPEIQQELDTLEKAMFAFDNLTGNVRSTQVKEKIFASLEEDFKEEEASKVATMPNPASVETKVIKFSPWKPFAVAASLVAILASAAAIYFAGKFYETDQKFTTLLQDQQILAENLNQVKL